MRVTSAGLIIAVVILIAFALSVPHTSEVTEVQKSAVVTETSVPKVTLKDAYKKGTHTISGSITAPNACTVPTATAALVGDASSTQAIAVAISMSVDTGICLQVPQTMQFTVSVNAPSGLPITATVNGAVASTTLQ